MGRFFYVDNTKGSDSYSGDTYNYPYLSLDKVIDELNLRGVPGDTVRLCYTGQDYTYASKSNIQGSFTQGNNWSDGEFFTIEGWDPNSGTDRPTLLQPTGPTAGNGLGFNTDANYWLIRDLHFKWPAPTSSWSNTALYFNSGLTDSDHYFKVRNCVFEGQHQLDSNEHSHAVYLVGGSRSHLDIQYCVFKNVQYTLRSNSTLPASFGWNIQHNIFINEYYNSLTQFYVSNIGDPIDFTYSNNTWVGYGPNQYEGYCCRMDDGGLTGNINFEAKNNFCFWVNYFMRKVVSHGIDDDLTNYVGYNTWGKVNAADRGYRGDFDVFETESDYRAQGDYNLHLTHNQSDYTSIFKGYADETYFWPETGWITTYDLRPIGWEMTSTMEDPINGLRGAIKHSGVYNDTTVTTQHGVDVIPYFYPCTNTRTYTIDDEYGMRGFGSFAFDLGKDIIHEFSNFGDTTIYNTGYDRFSYKSGNYSIYHTPTCSMLSDDSGLTYDLECQTECRTYGPSVDSTVTSVEFDNLEKKLVVGAGILPGEYYIELRVITPRTKERGPWVYAYQYTIL